MHMPLQLPRLRSLSLVEACYRTSCMGLVLHEERQQLWRTQGVSAWNFDVAALKEQAAREGDQPAMPTISEAPQASAEGGPQSYPLKLHPSGHDITPGNGKSVCSAALLCHPLRKIVLSLC